MSARRHNKRGSLLWRTVFLLFITVIVAQVAVYFWIQRSVSEHFEQMDSEILTHAAFNWRQRLGDIMMTNDMTPSTTATQSDSHSHLPAWQDYNVKSAIFDARGQATLSFPNDFIDEFPADFDVLSLQDQHLDQQFTFYLNNRHYRAVIIRKPPYLALLALPTDVHHEYLAQFKRQLILILLLITIILVSVAAFSVYWGFAPLTTIMQKMQGINPDRLDERIHVNDMPIELRALAASYNDMMATLEHNFAALLRFSDNIAHELRTPIATLSTQTQVMLSQPRNSTEYVEQLHHQLDTLAQLSAMINDMLLLAKTQKGLSDAQIYPVDTKDLIIKLVDYFEMMAEDRGIGFDIQGTFYPVLGDAGLLQRLFANLMSNAVYYAAADSMILISAAIDYHNHADDHADDSAPVCTITISNRLDKPLSPSEANRLFERFYRRDKSRLSGSGLGLSIVKAIARAHKGDVSITIKDQCFQVAVTLVMVSS